MAEIAKYIRIFNPNPDDDYVNKRIAVINAVEALLKKKTSISDILYFANEILVTLKSPETTNQFLSELTEPAFKKNSSSFVIDEEQIQILTCSLLATLQYVEKYKGKSRAISNELVLALVLHSGLTFQNSITEKEKLEELRLELLDACQRAILNSGITNRKRIILNEKEENLDTDPSLVAKTVYALTINAELDREELNILWWALANWSIICNSKLTDLSPIQAAVISSLEITKLLTTVPSEVAVHLSCKYSEIEEFTPVELKQGLADIQGKIDANFTDKKEVINYYPEIFPALNLLLDNNVDSTVKRKTDDWVSRILLEGSILNFDKTSK